jgi:hypothetical protein
LFERGRAPWAVWEDHRIALPVVDHETSVPLPALARRR